MKYKIAVLDDYQNAALESADWSALSGRADITVFQDHLDDTDAVIERLLPHDGEGDRAHPPSPVCCPSRGRERPDQAGAGVSERGRRRPGPPARRRQGPARSGGRDLLSPPGLPELRARPGVWRIT